MIAFKRNARVKTLRFYCSFDKYPENKSGHPCSKAFFDVMPFSCFNKIHIFVKATKYRAKIRKEYMLLVLFI